jgi:hypothetical protein
MKSKIHEWNGLINIPFLVFLIGVTSIKLQYKFVVIILYTIYMFVKSRKINFEKNGVTKFYILMPIVGLIGAIASGAFQWSTYYVGYIMSVVIWGMCAMTFILIKNTLQPSDTQKNKKTIEVFFILNAFICLLELLNLVRISGHPFPYWHPSMEHVYGVSTGDHLHGIFFGNVSTVNATISLLSVFYFIFQDKKWLAFIALIVCLLCTSNLSVLILVIGLVFGFVFNKGYRKQFFATLVLCGVMYTFLTPANIRYSQKIAAKIKSQFSKTSSETSSVVKVINSKSGKSTKVEVKRSEITGQIDTVITITEMPYMDNGRFRMNDILNDFRTPVLKNQRTSASLSQIQVYENTSALRNELSKWYDIPYDEMPLNVNPKVGKVVYAKQTFEYLKNHKLQFILGTGPGNFSSKLALKMTGFQLEGTYPEKFRYISKSFFENHFQTYMIYWAQSVAEHSIINYPGCVYWHIGGEYGLIGIALLIVFYLSFFYKKCLEDKRKFVFLVLLGGLFVFDYWFELLTLTIFFELFMLIAIPEKKIISKKIVVRNDTKHRNY